MLRSLCITMLATLRWMKISPGLRPCKIEKHRRQQKTYSAGDDVTRSNAFDRRLSRGFHNSSCHAVFDSATRRFLHFTWGYTHEHALNGKASVGAADEEVLGGVDRRQPLEVVGVLGLDARHPLLVVVDQVAQGRLVPDGVRRRGAGWVFARGGGRQAREGERLREYEGASVARKRGAFDWKARAPVRRWPGEQLWKRFHLEPQKFANEPRCCGSVHHVTTQWLIPRSPEVDISRRPAPKVAPTSSWAFSLSSSCSWWWLWWPQLGSLQTWGLAASSPASSSWKHNVSKLSWFQLSSYVVVLNMLLEVLVHIEILTPSRGVPRLVDDNPNEGKHACTRQNNLIIRNTLFSPGKKKKKTYLDLGADFDAHGGSDGGAVVAAGGDVVEHLGRGLPDVLIRVNTTQRKMTAPRTLGKRCRSGQRLEPTGFSGGGWAPRI